MISRRNKQFIVIIAALILGWSTSAFASSTSTTTQTSFQTTTQISTSTIVQVSTYTNTNAESQTDAQKNCQATYQAAMANAQALIAQGQNLLLMGMILLSDGSDDNDTQGWWLVMTGQQYINDGTRAYYTAKANYDQCTTNTVLLTNLNTSVNRSTATKVNSTVSYKIASVDDGDIGGGKGGGNGATGIKIDPALLRNGELSSKLEDFALKNGIGQEAMSKAMQTGDYAKMMGDHLGMGDSQLQKALDNANANPMSSEDMLAKANELGMSLDGQGLGSSSEDGSGQSGSGTYSLASGGGSTYGNGRGLASDGLGGGAGQGGAGGGLLTLKGAKGAGGSSGVSKDIQAALDRAGISNLTIFQIVHRQYMKKTPMFFGTQMKTSGPQTNPFAKSPYEGLDKDLQNQPL